MGNVSINFAKFIMWGNLKKDLLKACSIFSITILQFALVVHYVYWSLKHYAFSK